MFSKVVYTIGYDYRLFDDFIKILKHYMITKLVDVRRFPKSKLFVYRKDVLEKVLPLYGINYYWLGYELGGFRGGYLKYMSSQEFRLGIKKLIDIIVEPGYGYTCIMCLEKNPRYCHRRYIAEELCRRGFQVLHIIDLGNTLTHVSSLL
ncbi:MAG: DUF488 domain-containing protein [Staphylothermus sp.]|nr:DUF488 domain-containing protein [Staphylothermus sp.]